MKFKNQVIPRLMAVLAGAIVFAAGQLLAAVHTLTVTNAADSGSGSLRQSMLSAIAAAKNGPNADEYVIQFSIFSPVNVKSIRIQSPLPVITESLTIDGTTQNGYAGLPLIEITGADGNNFSGFNLRNGNLTLRGLVINRFAGYGISATPSPSSPHDVVNTGLTLTGCHIGTNAEGTAAAPNGQGGIDLRSVLASQIGGTGPFEGNVISGNGGSGIHVDARYVVDIFNNRIGTNRAGTAALPNLGYGIDLDCWSYPINIGGPGAGRNIVSGNTRDGLRFWGSPLGSSVVNNIIGLGADGTTDLGNGGNGISTEGVGIAVGGATASEGNIISGNGGYGIRFFHWFFDATPESGAASCRNNLIGTDLAGTVARGNSAGGILVDLFDITDDGNPPTGISGVEVALGASGAGNVISGNGGNGVTLSGAHGLLLGNMIGVTRSGAPLGNASSGVRLSNSSAILGRTPNPGNANTIGANGSNGITVTGASSLTAHGNYIGCTITGADVGNGGDGIEHGPWIGAGIMGVSAIGGAGSGMGNSIAYNNGDGVYLTEPFGIGSNYLSILGNSIWANSGLGIDLGPDGVTANDAGDTDAGANHRQNFPVLSAATPTKILGSLSSTPNTQFRLEFFRAQPDAPGYGEGRYYLGFDTVWSDAAGQAYFGLTGQNLAAGQSITATASVIGEHPDPGVSSQLIQDTSEFSQNITVGPEVGSVGFLASTGSVNEGAGSATITLVRSGVTTGTASVQYTVLSGTALVGSDLPAASGTVTFTPGQTQRTISVPVTNDSTDEADQFFQVRLSNPVNTELQSPSLTAITIFDNDLPPVVSFPNGYSIPEGHTGSQPLDIPVILSAVSELPVFVYYSSSPDMTAAIGSTGDITYGPGHQLSGRLDFAPGETTKVLSYLVNGDTQVEPDDVFGLSLSSPWNATIGTADIRIVILNDDDSSPGTLQFSAASSSVNENNGTATITVTRTGGTGGPASVNYALVGGTAVPGADFLPANTSGTLNFAHGQSSASFTITLVDDYVAEGPETMQFQFMGTTNAPAGIPAVTTLTITDSDSAGTLQFSTASYSAAENAGSATITVTRTGGTDGPATVSYARTGGTATAGSDFLTATTAGTLNFAHGQASASFTVTLLDDFLIEGPETLIFQLTGAATALLGNPAVATLTLGDNETAHSITGRVAGTDGQGIAGALVILTGSQNASFTTDSTGNYSFGGVVGGLNYSVVVTADGWTFAPSSLAFQNLSEPAVGQDFTGFREILPELSISALPDGRLLLNWPASDVVWTLKTSDTLQVGSWVPVTAPVTLRGENNQVILTAGNRGFFRLERLSSGGGLEEM